MRNILYITILLLIVHSTFAQVNYYVDNSLGSDSPGYGLGSGIDAWKTIEYAVNNILDPASDSIVINISADIYDLNNNQIDINRDFKNLTLLGQGTDATIIEAASDTSLSNSRVIQIYAGNKVLIKNLTVRYGNIFWPNRDGGGILNNGGDLTINYCKVAENIGGDSLGVGGGICNNNGTLVIRNSTITNNIGSVKGQGGGVGSINGVLSVSNSTVCYNTARLTAGGIFVASDGADAFFQMENTTIYGNHANLSYGGCRITIFGSSSPYNVTSNINSCTIFNNSAYNVYGGFGLTIPSSCSIRNTIVAGNFAYNEGSIPNQSNVTGSIDTAIYIITSGGYNIFQTISSNITLSGDTNNGIGLDPKLDILADNNTSNGTQTCATSLGSPAIDAIPGGNGAPLFDQRGAVRNGDYDIGAYEYWPDNALPVQLVSFSAKLINNEVLLNWETATEVNNFGFEIQRKTSGSWQSIAFVNGKGNSNSPVFYSYIDKNLIDGTLFLYRLKQIDNDGKYQYLEIQQVKFTPSKFVVLQNYPNPFNPVTRIEYQLPAESDVILKVYNILGSEIMSLRGGEQKAGIHEFVLNLEKFPSGTYIYKIFADDFVQTKKMLLIK